MSQWEYDAATIGGGATGCVVARESSRYEFRVCMMEWGEDMCSGTSRANNAIVHAGYDAVPGTRKAEFNMAGNIMMEQLSKDLDFSFKRNGPPMLCFTREEGPKLKELYEWGVANGVPGIRLTTGDGARSMEPNLTDEVVAAIYAPSDGIVRPFGLAIALAESTCENGVEFRLFTEMERIEKMESGRYGLIIRHEGATRAITAHYVVNTASVYVNTFHNAVSNCPIHITPGKGDYRLLNKEAGGHATSTIFQLSGIYGKGVLMTPAVYGNLLIGPTVTDIEDRGDVVTTVEELAEVISKSAWGVKNIPYRQATTSFAGLGAHRGEDDSVIDEAEGARGFYDAAGIESPELSHAPAIGVYLAGLITDATAIGKKEQFIVRRKGIPHLDSTEKEKRARLIRKRPDYGTIICRCENVGEGEIIDAIRRPLGVTSLDGIKRRARQGMGRYRTGFCMPRTVGILARELHISMEDTCENVPGFQVLTGINGGEKR